MDSRHLTRTQVPKSCFWHTSIHSYGVQLLKSHVFGQIIMNLRQFRVSNCYKIDVKLQLLEVYPNSYGKLQQDKHIYFSSYWPLSQCRVSFFCGVYMQCVCSFHPLGISSIGLNVLNLFKIQCAVYFSIISPIHEWLDFQRRGQVIPLFTAF